MSDEAGLMTGAVVSYDPSAWGAAAGQTSVPDEALSLWAAERF